MTPGPRRPGFFRRLQAFTLAAAALPAVFALVLLLRRGESVASAIAWGLVLLGWILLVGALQRQHVARPLQTLGNLLSALRERDFSFRARADRRDGALGEAMGELNLLADGLREQRLDALEATALLRTVMEEIDVAVYAFDASSRLRLVNRAGEALLGQPVERLLGRTADELGLAAPLAPDAPAVMDASFPGGAGRFDVRRGGFRQGGLPHQLLVLANVSRALRDEERQAWQRLIRVLGHELNNSLAPIKSIAGSLETLLTRAPRPADADADLQHGLSVISSRAEALGRFMDAYARLARLPAPTRRRVEVAALVRRAASVERRLAVVVRDGPTAVISVDADQLEQLLINLLRNATDATLETGGGVTIGWSATRAAVELVVDDDGPGLSSTANLFVPFFTTKPGGSGIGLVLSRQIAEAHGGTLVLEPRPDGMRGCRARLTLPRGR